MRSKGADESETDKGLENFCLYNIGPLYVEKREVAIVERHLARSATDWKQAKRETPCEGEIESRQGNSDPVTRRIARLHSRRMKTHPLGSAKSFLKLKEK